jgi:two-component system phosphate regulon response regulator PhoB
MDRSTPYTPLAAHAVCDAERRRVGIGGRILLAEDNEAMRSLLVGALREEGHEVTAVENGTSLLRLLNRGPQIPAAADTPFDLIVSDLRMPGPNGLDVLALMRPTWPRVPVILITAFGDEEVYGRASRLGLSEVIDKPFDVEMLLLRVREALGRAVAGAEADAPSGRERGGR